jgi:nucleoid-associated protein YgaU
MGTPRCAFLALIGVTVLACSPGATSVDPTTLATGIAEVTRPPVTATPAVTPESAAPTGPATSQATSAPVSPTSTPVSPTSAPVPPKPSGIDFEYCCGLGGDGVSRLRWEQPRTDGTEIRVYGVTTCFPAGDQSDESCLREHTALPDDIRILLARGPASKGEVAWPQGEGDGEDCTYEFLSEAGTSFYAVVASAYGASGHSIFAIADEGYVDVTEACTPHVIQAGDTLTGIAARYGITVEDLIAANVSTLPDPDKLPVGATILIPQSES